MDRYTKERIVEDIIEAINVRAKPEDIFDEKDLKKWAKDQGLEEIFESADLEEWALKNGFVKEE